MVVAELERAIAIGVQQRDEPGIAFFSEDGVDALTGGFVGSGELGNGVGYVLG